MSHISTPPTIAQFQFQFSRDFKYGPGLDAVRPIDIQNAINLANSVFNPRLFSTAPLGIAPNLTSEAITAYNYAAAHFLVLSIQGVGGLSKTGSGLNAQGEGIVGNKSVGGVSVGYVWPDTVTESPALSQFLKTTYGQLYLQILMPRLVGNVGAVFGETAGFDNFNGNFPVTGFLGPF